MRILRNSLPLAAAALLAGSAVGLQTPGGSDPGQGSVGGGGDGSTTSPIDDRGQPGYDGPGDTVPGDPPTDPPFDPGGPPPGDPGGPPPPGPGSPPQPPGSPPPPDIGNPGTTPLPPLAPSGPLTPTDFANLDLTQWTWWWDFNKEPWLALKDRIYAADAYTGGDEYYLGHGARDRGPAERRPSDADVYGKVVPALLHALDKENADDVIAGALIALARIGEDRESDKKQGYAKAITRFLYDGDQAVLETAVCALGILGDDSSAPLLSNLLQKNKEGRTAIGGRRVSARTRAFAAYALGLLGHQTANADVRHYAVHQLVWALETDRSGTQDVQAACVAAIGIIPVADTEPPLEPKVRRRDGPRPPGSSLAGQIDYLLDLLGQKRRDRLVRAQVPIALGRLVQASNGPNREALRAAVAEELLDRVAAHRREPREVIQSCTIALGMLGDNDTDDLDRRIRRRLVRMEDTTNDLPTRELALIALGRACGRAGAGEPDTLRDERNYLVHELVRGGTTMRPWAALAIGIMERGAAGGGGRPNAGAAKTLRLSLAGARSAREIGAYAIATGLLQDLESEDVLIAKLRTVDEEEAKGHTAVGIGLVPARKAEDQLVAILRRSTYRPSLLRDSATGLAVMGHDAVGGELTALLANARGLASQTAICTALGRVGDGAAIDPLLELLTDATLPSRTRAFAAAALGWVADKDDLPWNTVLSVDVNYHAATPTLFDTQGFGILNLL